jgi:RNA polymerase sigma-70 factor (ECF subfamily)
MPEDSSELVEAAASGRPEDVERLLEQHLPGLRAFIRLRSGPEVRARESASDLAQSVCREVLDKLDRFQWGGEAGFRAWLYTTALRRLQNRREFLRAQKRDVRREETPADGLDRVLAAYHRVTTPSGKLMAREELERIERAFDQLPDDAREVISLARLCGLSHTEIAERMNRTPGATRVLLHRSLARLAALLDEG